MEYRRGYQIAGRDHDLPHGVARPESSRKRKDEREGDRVEDRHLRLERRDVLEPPREERHDE
jgi:hypothetical protein